MVQGDSDWWQLAAAIGREDQMDATMHNVRASAEQRLRIPLGPLPCVGAITTAPVVLLLSHPAIDARSTVGDCAFRRTGWPLAALHPDAPAGPAEEWRDRVAELTSLFGAQHVANSVAAVYLVPWYTGAFDPGLRLPSRARMLALAASAAARDAILMMVQNNEQWTEHAELASLPTSRCIHPRSRRRAELSPRNLGEAWTAVCQRIEIHAW